MDTVALWLGYSVIALGTITAVVAGLYAFCNYNWHRWKDITAWAEVEAVLREVNRRQGEKK